MMEASASEKVEKNESGTEAFDSRLGERPIASGEFMRALEGQDKGMCLRQLPTSSASMPRNVSHWEACYEREKLTGDHPKKQLTCKI
jgi:hypothetical protein